MFSKVSLSLLLVVLALPGWAQHSEKEVKEDIERHQQMAAAHAAAAQCLKAGRKPDDCTKELQNACKGLALGKFCGMRHAH